MLEEGELSSWRHEGKYAAKEFRMSSQVCAGRVFSSEVMRRFFGASKINLLTVPVPRENEVVGYYAGWTLRGLRNTRIGRKFVPQRMCWYDQYHWDVKEGYYRLLFPPQFSSQEAWNWEAQSLIDTSGWKLAPIAVVASVILAQLAEDGTDLLHGDWVAGAESTKNGGRVLLSVAGNQLHISNALQSSLPCLTRVVLARTC